MSLLITEARVATFAAESLAASGKADGYGLIEDGAVVVSGDRIAWVGPVTEVPEAYRSAPTVRLGGRLVTPALIDAHTHLVFGGDRSGEFEQRLLGTSYAEIAAAGGGIRATVTATRAADEDTLVAEALPRLDRLLADGVGTVEIKSGYGLDRDTELRMLRAARRLAAERPVRVMSTFLGAHAVPPEHDADTYIDEICVPTLHAAAPLADAVDGFCETIAFTPAQIDRVFAAARALGLPVKLHADQLSCMGGTPLAARHNALSVDHLEYTDAEGVAAMADAGTIAMLLPGAFYTLRETSLPPVDACRAAGVPLAVATDCNPGSSPLTSLLMAVNMACTLFRLTPAEALHGTTSVAARALGRDDLGVIAPGRLADLAVWDVPTPAALAYRMGYSPLHRRMHGGCWVA